MIEAKQNSDTSVFETKYGGTSDNALHKSDKIVIDDEFILGFIPGINERDSQNIKLDNAQKKNINDLVKFIQNVNKYREDNSDKIKDGIECLQSK